jgi:hypothetical protein
MVRFEFLPSRRFERAPPVPGTVFLCGANPHRARFHVRDAHLGRDPAFWVAWSAAVEEWWRSLD